MIGSFDPAGYPNTFSQSAFLGGLSNGSNTKDDIQPDLT